MDIRTIFVKKIGGIGNVVLATPMLEYLARAIPGARTTVMVESEGGRVVLEGNPYVHRTIVVPRSPQAGGRALTFFYETLKATLRMRRERFDLVINGFAGYAGGSLLAALFTRMIGGRYSAGYAKGPWRFLYSHPLELTGEMHEVERNLDLARIFGPLKDDGPPPRPRIYLSDEDRSAARSLLDKWGAAGGDLLIGMHPGSGALESKRWNREKYAALIDLIRRKLDARVILFGGRGETGLADEIMSAMEETAISAAGKTTLKETVALIEACKLFISNDTGLMHIAAAADVPVVAIFGPTNFMRTAPFGPRHRIVKAEMPCLPCYRGKGIPCDHVNCLEQVSVEEVFDQVRGLSRTLSA